jgi:hypothetical protein
LLAKSARDSLEIRNCARCNCDNAKDQPHELMFFERKSLVTAAAIQSCRQARGGINDQNASAINSIHLNVRLSGLFAIHRTFFFIDKENSFIFRSSSSLSLFASGSPCVFFNEILKFCFTEVKMRKNSLPLRLSRYFSGSVEWNNFVSHEPKRGGNLCVDN